MKYILMLFLMLFTIEISPQATDDFICAPLSGSSGGLYKPSRNGANEYLRVLVVFIQFEGDNSTADGWDTLSMPTWAYSFINSLPHTQYTDKTYSDYWNEMAVGDFDFIGTVFPQLVILPPESTYASTGKNFSHSNLDAIEIVDNYGSGWNWSLFDNWKYNSGTHTFDFSAGYAEGYVDMIFMIYRNSIYYNPNDSTDFPGKWFGGGWGAFDGAATLGINGFNFNTHDGNYYVYAPGGSTVSSTSSGITMRTGGPKGKWETIGIMAHEYGHYLFGGGHTNYSGVMAGGTFAMNGWERIKVHQIDPIVASGSGNEYYLGDFIGTGDVLKIPIPINVPSSSTYFLVENHQRTSSYDHIVRGETIQGGYEYTGLGKGLFVYLVKYGDTYTDYYIDKFEMLAADGYFDWEYVGDYYAQGFYHTRPCSNYVPITERIAVNRQTGKNDRMPKHIQWCPTSQWAAKWVDEDIYGTLWFSRDYMGDFTDAFNLGYNELLTRWSNPSTYVNGHTDISIQLVNENAGICTVKVFSTYNDGLSLPPSKPQFLQLTWYNNHPKLIWDANLEDDLNHYEIYKKRGTGNYYYFASTTNTYYVDSSELKFSRPHTKIYIYYKIIAVDDDDYESVFSDEKRAGVNDDESKRTAGNEDIILKPDEYKLSSNYPNPFNPTTVIEYQLAKDSYVTLNVYNMLGEKVADLVNGFEETGYYSIQFDGSNFPSGMYIYRIQAGEFSDVKKMLLLK